MGSKKCMALGASVSMCTFIENNKFRNNAQNINNWKRHLVPVGVISSVSMNTHTCSVPRFWVELRRDMTRCWRRALRTGHLKTPSASMWYFWTTCVCVHVRERWNRHKCRFNFQLLLLANTFGCFVRIRVTVWRIYWMGNLTTSSAFNL